MRISRLRRYLYAAARLLGDYQAVRRDRVGRRISSREAGRLTGRWLRRMLR